MPSRRLNLLLIGDKAAFCRPTFLLRCGQVCCVFWGARAMEVDGRCGLGVSNAKGDPMMYFTAKALHMIGFVCWFAGLFYSVRLFIYYVESQDRQPQERHVLQSQLLLMARRLWYGITWPSLVVTVGCGTWLLTMYPEMAAPWIRLKLLMVLGLVVYHLVCGRILKRMQEPGNPWTSSRLRLWNELATLFLVAIIFLAIFKNGLDMLWALGGLFVFGLVLMGGIAFYRRIRAGEQNLQRSG